MIAAVVVAMIALPTAACIVGIVVAKRRLGVQLERIDRNAEKR